ncbi:GIY-YIG catalytic domain protein [compost metagenome]
MSKFIVYELINPLTNGVFYVGYSSRGEKRIKEHLGFGKRCNTLTANVIAQIRSQELGVQYKIVLETENETEALNLERELIAKYGRIQNGSGTLTNRTSGGQGCNGMIPSEQMKAKLSKYRKGKTYDELHGVENAIKFKERQSKNQTGDQNSMFGRRHSETARASMSANSRDNTEYEWTHADHGSLRCSRHALIEQFGNLSVTELGRVARGKLIKYKGWMKG